MICHLKIIMIFHYLIFHTHKLWANEKAKAPKQNITLEIQPIWCDILKYEIPMYPKIFFKGEDQEKTFHGFWQPLYEYHTFPLHQDEMLLWKEAMADWAACGMLLMRYLSPTLLVSASSKVITFPTHTHKSYTVTMALPWMSTCFIDIFSIQFSELHWPLAKIGLE